MVRVHSSSDWNTTTNLELQRAKWVFENLEVEKENMEVQKIIGLFL